MQCGREGSCGCDSVEDGVQKDLNLDEGVLLWMFVRVLCDESWCELCSGMRGMQCKKGGQL